MKLKTLLAATALSVGSIGMFASTAHAKLVEFEWTGDNDITLSGSFSYDSSLSGVIEESDLDSFEMEAFFFGGSLGSTWNMLDGVSAASSAFNFNFDVDSLSFVYGGTFDTSGTHISWGDTTTGLAFVGGSVANGIIFDGFDLPGDPNFPQDFDFQFSSVAVGVQDQFSVTVVPTPGSLALLGLGVAGLLVTRKRARS